MISPKAEVVVVVGAPYTGKTTVSTMMGKHIGYKVIDMKYISEEVTRKRLGTEDEPFEGDVPLHEV